MSEISRYRSYTTYSEENGKLVPSIEPQEKDAKYHVLENIRIVDRVTGEAWSIGEKKLKTDTLPNIVETKPLTNVSTK
jgi:hypothetical protein